MAALTTQQQQQVASYFSQNVYGAMNQTATNGTDTLATAVGTIDIAVTVGATALSGTISCTANVSGRFTVPQLEILMAHTLLKRAGAI